VTLFSVKNYRVPKKNSWDLSVRLGYFVTSITAFRLTFVIPRISQLGFERKARLFCDGEKYSGEESEIGWDLSVRLGYFVTIVFIIFSFVKISWDLSVRLGYFVTF